MEGFHDVTLPKPYVREVVVWLCSLINTSVASYIYIYIYIYRLSQEEGTKLRESVPNVKIY